MPLLEVIQTRQISASSDWMRQPQRKWISMPLSFTRTADDVVVKVLNYVFSKDRDFQEFLKTLQAGQVTPSLRIGKAAATGGGDMPERKTAIGAESVESAKGRKA